jgi:phosphonate transport system substrate-binding protein
MRRIPRGWGVAFLVVLTSLAVACSSGGGASPTGASTKPAASQPAGGQPAAGAAAAPISMIRFGVGPLMPTANDTKAAWEPFFRYLAQQLGAQSYDLVATTDWAGISVAMSGGQVDVAWMGPWGYVLSHNEVGAEAIATAKYDEKPIYYAIVVGQPGNTIRQFPEDARGKRISFADVGSTSGWLIPTAWLKKQGIDAQQYFQYSEGATHAANEIAVAEKQVDLATDFDRNRTAMIEGGSLPADATAIVWQSDPLPNDAIAVRKGLDPALAERIRTILLAITPEQAKEILPNHYTGFVAATHQDYGSIEEAGILVGRLQKQ